MRDFRIYMAVGGMPQAVEAYVSGANFDAIDRVKQEIIELYKADFKKVYPSGRLSAIFEAIPAQLAAKKSHRHEVDFLLADGSKIVVVEVKSSSASSHKSIDEFSERHSHDVSKRILFSQKDVANEGMLELKPIYLAPVVLEGLEGR